MSKFKQWLIKLIAGDSSVILNVKFRGGKAVCRDSDHLVTKNEIDAKTIIICTENTEDLC